ncbi:9654_t:CDS:10 [Dentiscutata heterogama]|uniref:9654_t:CDS:1 n=1 Tax=Dentiscutata heterogama TaxID=1316150 RepID=A0ACA9KU22_9GLOM|nr:9654_t:CDS:10 [Dentiscutata heterogama]
MLHWLRREIKEAKREEAKIAATGKETEGSSLRSSRFKSIIITTNRNRMAIAPTTPRIGLSAVITKIADTRARNGNNSSRNNLKEARALPPPPRNFSQLKKDKERNLGVVGILTLNSDPFYSDKSRLLPLEAKEVVYFPVTKDGTSREPTSIRSKWTLQDRMPRVKSNHEVVASATSGRYSRERLLKREASSCLFKEWKKAQTRVSSWFSPLCFPFRRDAKEGSLEDRDLLLAYFTPYTYFTLPYHYLQVTLTYNESPDKLVLTNPEPQLTRSGSLYSGTCEGNKMGDPGAW